MQELTNLCKNCLGCNRLEDPNFKGVNSCIWNTKKGGKDDIINIFNDNYNNINN